MGDAAIAVCMSCRGPTCTAVAEWERATGGVRSLHPAHGETRDCVLAPGTLTVAL